MRSRRGRRGRTRRCARGGVASPPSRSEALPAFAAAALEDRPAAARAHPRPESVGLGPLPLLRLIGALHRASQYTDARRAGSTPKSFLRHLRSGPDSASQRVAMVGRRCTKTRPQQDLDSLWQDVQARLRASVPESTFQLWLEPLKVVGSRRRDAPTSPRPRASGPGSSGATRRLIREALAGAGVAAHRGQLRAGGEAASRRGRGEPPSLNPNYTFERFVIGEGNRFAHAAALAVAEAPSEAYNPLFLHGPPGLGKTHLLVAIANYLGANAPGLSVRYTTAECFTNEFVAALRSERRRGVQAPLPRPRRPARRRRPVPRGQAPHRGGVLPHLQRPLRRGQPARPLRRPHPQRALDPRGAAARPLRVGPDRRRRAAEPGHPPHRPAPPGPRGRASTPRATCSPSWRGGSTPTSASCTAP